MKKINLKVFHILDHFMPHYSGYTFRTKAILSNQKELGIEPTLVISPKHSSGLPIEEVVDGLSCFRSASFNGKYEFPFLKEYLLMRRFKKDILRLAKKEKPGLIHAHSPILDGIPAYEVAHNLNIPMIYEVRALWEDAAVDLGRTKAGSLRYSLTRHLETDLFKKVDCIITICEGLKQEFIKRGINSDKIRVVPNGVDTVRFKPQAPSQELLTQYNLKGRSVIGFIGSFYKYEGLSLLIQALPKIIKDYPDAVLMLVGKGEVEADIKELAGALRLNGNVIFTGQIPNDKITEYYSIMDVLVYPRDKIRLTDLVTPLKPLEAMAMGKAVLGSDCGGIQEITQKGKSGVLFKAGDIEDLSGQCVSLLKDKSRQEALALSALEYVKSQRNWETIIGKEIEIYKEVIARREATEKRDEK